MKKILAKVLGTHYDLFDDEITVTVIISAAITGIIVCVVLFGMPSIYASNNMIMSLRQKRIEIITDYINTINRQKEASKHITDAKLKAMLEAQPSEPYVYNSDDASESKHVEEHNTIQKAPVKSMPATLKAIPNKPLSAIAELHPKTITFVTKGPTYTWRSSGTTVTVTYSDGTTTSLDKKVLKDLLGN